VRPLLIFLVGIAIAFGVLAAIVVVARPSERAFVVVDTSFPMRDVWGRVPRALDEIHAEGFAEYALASEKDLIHSWQSTLRFRNSTPFAPCDFSEIEAYDEASEADVRVLVTTDASCPTTGLGGWRIVSLSP
jgi:hypothetical protein